MTERLSVSLLKQMSTVTVAFTGQSRNLHIMAGIFSIRNPYLAGKTFLLVRDMLVNFVDIMPETSKNSACWDMGRNSHLRSQLTNCGAVWRCHIPFCPEVKGMPSFEWFKIKEGKNTGNPENNPGIPQSFLTYFIQKDA